MTEKVLGSEKDEGVSCVHWTEVDTTPTAPTAGGVFRIYMKADKLVIQYNDGGTVKYRYMDLTSTDATWVYTVTAP